MSKLREDANAQRDDIVAFFSSVRGMVISAIVLVGFGAWFLTSFIADLIAQSAV